MVEKGVRFVISVLPWPNTGTTGSLLNGSSRELEQTHTLFFLKHASNDTGSLGWHKWEKYLTRKRVFILGLKLEVS